MLFVSEDVTLAQVVRLVRLAEALDPARYEVHFACGSFDGLVFGDSAFERHRIATLDREKAFRALSIGKRLYETRDLLCNAEEDLELFFAVRPAVVVGDFRLSLAASAPFAKVPLVTLINAYWSPFAVRGRFPLPEHPVVDVVGPAVASRFFPLVRSTVFDHFARPVNAVRKRFGLRPVGGLLDVLTFGDVTLYPDPDGLVPTKALPASHTFLGPILWSPNVPLPTFFEALQADRPLAYVTLGSSGRLDRLPVILRGLERAGLTSVVATAGRRSDIAGLTPYVADYLPGSLVAGRSAIVVSNGGSSTGYQAMAEGVPVLGIPSNLDQYLAMTAIEDAGAGILLRSGTLTERGVAAAASRLVAEARYREVARKIAASIGDHDAQERFRSVVARFD